MHRAKREKRVNQEMDLDSKRQKQLENEDFKYYKTNMGGGNEGEVNMKPPCWGERGTSYWGWFVCFLF